MNQKAYMVRLELPAHSRFLPLLGATIQQLMAYLQEAVTIAEADMVAYELEMAAHEVCMNIIDHAYKNERRGSIRLTFSAKPDRGQIVVLLLDTGDGFDPQRQTWPPAHSWELSIEQGERQYQLTAVPEPSLEQERGRGLYLITQLVDEVQYVPLTCGNQWRLAKQVR